MRLGSERPDELYLASPQVLVPQVAFTTGLAETIEKVGTLICANKSISPQSQWIWPRMKIDT
jgi:hypothetical protein